MESRIEENTTALPMFDAAAELMKARGADEIEHAGGTLLDHVVRVAHLLAGWGADADVQIAGLCHACYGTDGFPIALLQTTQRSTLAGTIGERAEALVYLYGSCDRDFVYPQLDRPPITFRDRFTGTALVPDEASLRAFLEITAANELDVVRHNPQIAALHGDGLKALIKSAERRLSAGALEAWSIES